MRWSRGGTDRGVEGGGVQQAGHFVLREEHGAGAQTSLIQLLLHQIPESLEKICKKASAVKGLEGAAAGWEEKMPPAGQAALEMLKSLLQQSWALC